jgi:hypothetical protein
MPTVPWVTRQTPDPDRTYAVMLTHLPLRHAWSIPGFLRDTSRIRSQLARSPGLVGYSLRADLLRKRFWTLSAWTDEASLRAFARQDPHRAIAASLASRMGDTRFDLWQVPGNDLPLGWEAALRRAASPPEPARAGERLGG